MSNGVARLASKVLNHPANEGRKVAQLAQAVRFQVRGRVLGKPTVIPIGEHSAMLATLDSSATILATYANPPDWAEWQVWKRWLRPGDLFVDVGANVGTYSLLAADLGATIIPVEPDHDNVERLKANLGMNDYPAEIWVLALTAEPGEVVFSSGKDSENHLLPASSDGHKVRGERFDSLIGGRHVRGMKVDVEGAERQVVEGARDTLAAGGIDLIQIEWNHCARTNFGESRDRLRDLLAAYDFALYRPDNAGVLHPDDGSEGRDVFAARPETVTDLIANDAQ